MSTQEGTLPNKSVTTEMAASKEGHVKLSWREKICYGFGDFGNGFMFDLGQAYLTKYWIDVCTIPAAAVAGIFAFTKIFDAFMDPIAGSVIDGRKNIGPRGKFRPVMMASAVILASVMTRDVEERSQMATTRQAGSIGAQLITGMAFVPVVLMFASPHEGFFAASIVMSIIGVIGFAICYFNCHEHVPVKRNTQNEQKAKFSDYIKLVFTNKPLLCIILMTLFTISAMNTNNQMMIFFCQYNLGHMGLQPIVNGIMMGCSVVGILLIPKLVKMFGKKKTAIGGLLIGCAADLLNFVIPTNIYTFIILVTIGYVALAIPNGVTWAFVSDVIDYSEWHNGIRKEGITYAAFNFSRKIAQALAAVVSSGILVLTGYVANAVQSEMTLMGIKAAITLYPGVALGIAAIILYFFYGLTDDKFKKIADDLNHGKWEHGTIE